MGVTRRFDEITPIRVEHTDNYANYDLSESGDEASGTSDTAKASRSRRNKEKREERRMRKFFDEAETGGVGVKSNMGSRKWRRVHDARSLLALADKDDICLDYSDTIPHTLSSFQQLFVEKSTMKAWNEFVEKDEHEQRKILEDGNWTEEERKGWFIVGGKPSTPCSSRDLRNHHPAYSGKACYERIDQRSRKILSGRTLPWAFIDKLDRQLRAFFNADNAGIFIGTYPTPIERALVHAVAQFLFLKSKSVTDQTQVRITEISNSRSFFIPPQIMLLDHISSLRSKRIEFVPYEDDEVDESHLKKVSS